MTSALLLPVSPMELGLILLVVLLIFGASRLADLGTGLGEGIRNFKKSIRDENGDGGKPLLSDSPATSETAQAERAESRKA